MLPRNDNNDAPKFSAVLVRKKVSALTMWPRYNRTYPSVVMVTNAHHIPSIGPRTGEAGNSFALNTKSCENENSKD